MNLIFDEKFWAGSQSNYMSVLDAQTAITSALSAGSFANTKDEDEDEGSRLLSIDEGVGVIEVAGGLVNSDSPWLQFLGLTGYPEIRAALIEAAENPDVKEILMDYRTGGGAVSGVDDTAKLIRHINDNIKPVTSFAETAASAGYWLASSAGAIYAGKTSMVGSIGVIATHMEYSEQLKAEGVGATVIRAGSEKARANSVEKLDAKGKEQIQQAVDATYTVFVEHVAAMRDKSYEFADKQMADGKEFIGQAALDVGLVDKIATYDEVMSDLKEKALASSDKTMQNQRKGGAVSSMIGKTSSGDNVMARKTLNEQEALAASLGVEASVESATEIQPEAAGETQPQPQPATEIQPEAAGATQPQPQPQLEAADQSAVVSLLTAQLKEKDAELLSAKVESAKIQDKLSELEASLSPMIGIVSKSINTMQIALGGSAISHEGSSASAVVAEHGRVMEAFTAKFKVGGVAAASSDATAKATTVDPRHIARVNAARFNQK